MAEVKRFYNVSVIPELAQDVNLAEEARQDGEHDQIELLYLKWINGRDLLPTLEQRSQRFDLAEEKDLVRAGFAGLGRIRHVDSNSRIQITLKKADQNPSADIQTFTDEIQSYVNHINEIGLLYDQLGIDSLPPFSIHGVTMCWPLEIAQDWMNTYSLTGEDDLQTEKAIEAITNGTAILRKLEEGLDLFSSDEILKAADYSHWRDRKLYLGTLSALGVVESRVARQNKYLPWLIQGQQHVYDASRYEPNPHRLATVSYWLIAASLSSHYHGALPFRVEGFFNGIGGVSQAVMLDHKAALSSFRQMVRENK